MHLVTSTWTWLMFWFWRSKRRSIFHGPDWFSYSVLHVPPCSAAVGRPSDCWEIQWVKHTTFNISAISPHLSSVNLVLLHSSEHVPEYCAGPEALLSADDLQYTPLSSPTENAATQSDAPSHTLVPGQDPPRCFAATTHCLITHSINL